MKYILILLTIAYIAFLNIKDNLCCFIPYKNAIITNCCLMSFEKPWFQLQFPFYPNTLVQCLQGNINLSGSHSDNNTLFALDLQSKYRNTKIYAANDGIAYVFSGCFDNSDEDQVNYDSCGSGYGNHIKILDHTGHLTLYAHLSKIFIINGQYVKQGTKIGQEGNSGKAGKRHLHFSVHKYNQSNKGLSNSGWTGIAIPFIMKVRYEHENTARLVPSTNFRCGTHSVKFYGIW
ncbi:peptidase M23 (plasmid) [Candidatus Megaera polyxenophila]|nr:peptidase M23 [Candidatus Megaera polyxenophila]